MFCQKCGTTNEDSANYCRSCGSLLTVIPPAKPFDQDPAMRMLLPVGRSGWAIAAGYFGLFSVLLIFAPFAILCSILAIMDLKKNQKKCGMGRAVFGLVMGVLGCVGLVALVVAWWGSCVGSTN